MERGRAAQVERISEGGQTGEALKEGTCVRGVATTKQEVDGGVGEGGKEPARREG